MADTRKRSIRLEEAATRTGSSRTVTSLKKIPRKRRVAATIFLIRKRTVTQPIHYKKKPTQFVIILLLNVN